MIDQYRERIAQWALLLGVAEKAERVAGFLALRITGVNAGH
jgi:hypothetical protein